MLGTGYDVLGTDYEALCSKVGESRAKPGKARNLSKRQEILGKAGKSHSLESLSGCGSFGLVAEGSVSPWVAEGSV